MRRSPLILSAILLNLAVAAAVVWLVADRLAGGARAGAEPAPEPAGATRGGTDRASPPPATASRPAPPPPALPRSAAAGATASGAPEPGGRRGALIADAVGRDPDGKPMPTKVAVVEQDPDHLDHVLDAVAARPEQRAEIRRLWDETLRRRLELMKQAQAAGVKAVDEGEWGEKWRAIEREWQERARRVLTPAQVEIVRRIEQEQGLIDGP